MVSRNLSVLDCIQLIEENISQLEKLFDSIEEIDSIKIFHLIEKSINELSNHILITLEEIVTQWELATKTHRLSLIVPGSKVVVGCLNNDEIALEYGISSMKIGQTEVVHSQRFSLSEFKWDHTFDLYLSGIVTAVHWEKGKGNSPLPCPTRESSGRRDGPYVTVCLDTIPAVQSQNQREFIVPINSCIPWEKFDDSFQISLGQYLLLSHQGIFEPIRLVEVEQVEDDPRRKKYSFQYKSRKIIRSTSHEHTFLKMGHPFPACPSPFYALIHFITCIPSLLDSAVRTKLKQAFQENYHDHNMTNFNIERLPGYFSIPMKWKSVLSKEFNHRSQCGMGRLVINCLAQLSDLEPLPEKNPEGHTTATGISNVVQYQNNTTTQYNQLEIDKVSICRHTFRTLEDLCSMFSSLMLSSIVSSVEEDKNVSFEENPLPPPLNDSPLSDHESIDHNVNLTNPNVHSIDIVRPNNVTNHLPGNSISVSASVISRTSHPGIHVPQPPSPTISSLSSSLSTLSRFAEECLSSVLSTYFSPPYIVPTREWCLTMRSILDARDSLITLLNCIDILGDLPTVEALFVQRIADIQDILPNKIEESMLQCSYIYESMFMDDVFREEWDSNAPYRRGKKVSSGIVALGMSYRGFIFDIITIFGQHHIQFARRLCVGILNVALRAILNLYSALSPSRIRCIQLRTDLSAAINTFYGTVKWLQEQNILPTTTTHFPLVSPDYFSYLLSLHKISLMEYVTSISSNLHSSLSLYSSLYHSSSSSMHHENEIHLLHTQTTEYLIEMNIEDYGYKDSKDLYLCDLTDSLAELCLFTLFQITSPSFCYELVSSIQSISIQNEPLLSNELISLNLSPEILSLISCQNIKLKNDFTFHFIQLLECIQTQINSNLKDPSMTTNEQHQEFISIIHGRYNSIEDILFCCGATSQPLYSLQTSIPDNNIKSNETPIIYCQIHPKVLNYVSVRLGWLIDIICLRYEVVESSNNYPTLNEEEIEIQSKLLDIIKDWKKNHAIEISIAIW